MLPLDRALSESASNHSRPSSRIVDSHTWAAQPGTLLASVRAASGRGDRPLPSSMTYSIRCSQSPSRSKSSARADRTWSGESVGAVRSVWLIAAR